MRHELKIQAEKDERKNFQGGKWPCTSEIVKGGKGKVSEMVQVSPSDLLFYS